MVSLLQCRAPVSVWPHSIILLCPVPSCSSITSRPDSHDYVGELQRDQLRRYVEIKQSELPSSVTARKTKEFRCPPREQVSQNTEMG